MYRNKFHIFIVELLSIEQTYSYMGFDVLTFSVRKQI